MKVFVLESQKNVAVAINAQPRKNFAVGEQVVVSRQEARSLIQLGFKVIGEVVVTPDILKTPNESELSGEVCKDCETLVVTPTPKSKKTK